MSLLDQWTAKDDQARIRAANRARQSLPSAHALNRWRQRERRDELWAIREMGVVMFYDEIRR